MTLDQLAQRVISNFHGGDDLLPEVKRAIADTVEACAKKADEVEDFHERSRTGGDVIARNIAAEIRALTTI